MKAVLTVVGKDVVGILAQVSSLCAEKDANILEVTQSILQDMFVMVMMIDLSKCTIPFSELSDILTNLGDKMGLKIHVMHEDIFNSMHKI